MALTKFPDDFGLDVAFGYKNEKTNAIVNDPDAAKMLHSDTLMKFVAFGVKQTEGSKIYVVVTAPSPDHSTTALALQQTISDVPAITHSIFLGGGFLSHSYGEFNSTTCRNEFSYDRPSYAINWNRKGVQDVFGSTVSIEYENEKALIEKIIVLARASAIACTEIPVFLQRQHDLLLCDETGYEIGDIVFPDLNKQHFDKIARGIMQGSGEATPYIGQRESYGKKNREKRVIISRERDGKSPEVLFTINE